MEIVSTASVVWGLVRRFWWVALLAGLAVALLLTGNRLEQAKSALAEERAAHTETKRSFETTVADYRAAATQAQLLAQRNVERVRAEQSRITQETVNEYQVMAADTDARYRSLQRKAAEFEANTSGPSGAGVSLASSAACGAYAGTTCEEIPALLNAAELNTNQLLALQRWVREQAKVRVTAEPAPRN